MRYITDHEINPVDQQLNVIALDGPGHGGACHLYEIEYHPAGPVVRIPFQNGPVGEAGINGITNEALLAVVIDRLRGFQSWQYACRENALALTNLEQAMHWLHHRTRDRVARGVEGTTQV